MGPCCQRSQEMASQELQVGRWSIYLHGEAGLFRLWSCTNCPIIQCLDLKESHPEAWRLVGTGWGGNSLLLPPATHSLCNVTFMVKAVATRGRTLPWCQSPQGACLPLSLQFLLELISSFIHWQQTSASLYWMLGTQVTGCLREPPTCIRIWLKAP